MINQLALTSFLGFPMVMYGGLFTLLLMLATATVGALNFKGKNFIPLKWHPRLAFLTILLALVHAFFDLSIFLNF